ncbi:MAG: tetratricopeptide repeat protein [Elusimicrobiales bacterium]|nr:tetratricopeptide repeat protein [Elusimicrobiales bacterium]
MRKILTVLLFASALPAAAQVPQHTGPEKNITAQTLAELTQTAADLERQLLQLPENTDLHIKLGFTYTRLGRADDALRAFESAVRLDPKRAIAHYMLGLIYEKKGLRDKAITSWKACLDNTGDPNLRNTAVKHLNNLGAR